jgi:hypothetical protein
LIYFAVAMARFLWHDRVMGKRSSRMAKRDDFENGFRTAGAAIGASRGKNPAVAAPERQGELKGEKAGDAKLASSGAEK